ncbi:MAG: hypothetical protein IJQ62_05675 [Clostridia bacterium]|nr:hypothetical protein [Clostridia bacterium]MBR0227822.1 hypothetical protein [Clostridia bacterium]
MAWWLTAVFLLLIAPVRAGVRVRWDEKGLRGAVGLMVWGLREQADFTLARSAAGQLRLAAAFHGKSLPLPQRKNRAGLGMKLLGLLLKSNGKNAILGRLVRVTTLRAFLRLGGQDAAALALTAGTLRAVGGALPLLRFQCVPVLGGKTALQAVCIAESRLGILLAAWLMWKRRENQS